MAKNRNFTVPLAPVIGLFGIITMPRTSSPTHTILSDTLGGDFTGAGYTALENLLGVDAGGRFHFDYVLRGWTPLFLALAIHYISSKLGLNRMLGRAGVPFIRI